VDVSALYLYAGFAAGWLLGRWKGSRSPWVGRLTLAAVCLLVAFLGLSFRSVSGAALAATLPVAVAFTAAILGATTAVFLALRGRPVGTEAAVPSVGETRPDRIPTSALVVAALLVGYGAGRYLVLPTTTLITIALTVLLALVGYSIELSWGSLRRAWVPIASAAAGALVGAGVLAGVGAVGADAALATSLGFGWYSLAGPLVASRLGATVGLLAFLVNFLREALTMVLSPYLGRRLRGEGLAALGGATAMDTTLYFVVRYGDRKAGALSVASGLTLTVLASLLVPLVLAL
jgi:uncharacterized membrane protein YbjE (DUF340 family)